MQTTPETNMQAKLRFSKKHVAIIAIIIICILVTSAIWYFFYFMKTPGYSLKIIKNSIEQHDVVEFKKHVDLDNLLSRGFDDLLSAMIESDQSMKPEAKKMVFGFAQMLKAPATSGVKDAIIHYVETGKWADDSSKNKEVNQSGINTDRIAESTGIKNSAFHGITYSKEDGNVATVGIKIYDESVDEESVLDIQMRKLDDGSWQIAEISNLKDYLMTVEKTRNKVLNKYIEDTKPIVDKANTDLNEFNQKLSTASSTEKIIIYQNMQEIEKNKIMNLDTITIPEASKSIAELRKKICDLKIQFWQKQIEFLQSNDQNLLNEINGIQIQVKTLDNQLLSIISRAKNSQ